MPITCVFMVTPNSAINGKNQMLAEKGSKPA